MTLFLIAISLLVPFAAKIFRPHRITWTEMSLHMLVVMVMVSLGMHVGKYADTLDFEIWNGAATAKVRDHGSYVRSYQCMCVTTCSGTGSNYSCRTTCQTCYETRYTVDWRVNSTIGWFNVASLDRASRSVYNAPDPEAYRTIQIGDPVSREVPYTNYIRGVSESLFSRSEMNWDHLSDFIPEYPRVRNLWQFNRVLAPGLSRDFSELNHRLNLALRDIGPRKEANVIVVIAGTNDRNLRYALESAWSGGKKNDVIVLIGSPDGNTIAWAEIITMAANYRNTDLEIHLSRAIMSLGTIEDQSALSDAISTNVSEHFQRVPMEEFEYLKNELAPPMWVVIMLMLITTAISFCLVAIFDRVDVSVGNLWARYRKKRNNNNWRKK
jgi:hypothetical protein